MLNRHKDELSLEWDKRWEHLQLGKKTTSSFPLPSLLPLSSSPLLFLLTNPERLSLMNVCLWFTVLEVMQFARDAHMAEGWMIAQEPYLKNENLGVSDLFLLCFLSRFYGKFRRLSENCRTISHQRENWLLGFWKAATLGLLEISTERFLFFSLCVFLDRSQWSRTAFGETRKLREASQHSRRTIPCLGAPHNGNLRT